MQAAWPVALLPCSNVSSFSGPRAELPAAPPGPARARRARRQGASARAAPPARWPAGPAHLRTLISPLIPGAARPRWVDTRKRYAQLQGRKLRFGGVRQLAPGHRARRQGRWHGNLQVSCSPRPPCPGWLERSETPGLQTALFRPLVSVTQAPPPSSPSSELPLTFGAVSGVSYPSRNPHCPQHEKR